MTNQIQRPSDEVTGRVVAEWKEHKLPKYQTTLQGVTVKSLRLFYDATKSQGVDTEWTRDPRDDTDAANELLEHILSIVGKDACLLGGSGTGWMVMYEDRGSGEPGFWPLKTSKVSGEQFRYAVVELAAEILND